MKTNFKKGLFVCVTLLAFMVNSTFAQDTDNTTEKSKKEKREEARKASLEIVKAAAQDSMFVIEANTLRGRNTFSQFVSSNTNFVKFEGEEVVIQTANPFGVGYNGLGGITLNGDVLQYNLSKDEKGVRIIAQISSPFLGHSTLNISISANGNSNAILRTNRGGYLQIDGDMALLKDSRHYEGTSIL